MILSYDEIRAAAMCPDCARRDVKITTCSGFDQLHDVLLDEMGLCLCAMREYFRDIPLNVVETLHDPGCPKLEQITPSRFDELQIHPVDLSDEHPWVIKIRELAEHE